MGSPKPQKRTVLTDTLLYPPPFCTSAAPMSTYHGTELHLGDVCPEEARKVSRATSRCQKICRKRIPFEVIRQPLCTQGRGQQVRR
ncbi:hypothetical protein P9112_006806 [Eukaryota sp. TZLM1-RC]